MDKLDEMKAEADQLRGPFRSSFGKRSVRHGKVSVGSVINRHTGRPMFRYFIDGKPASEAAAREELNA